MYESAWHSLLFYESRKLTQSTLAASLSVFSFIFYFYISPKLIHSLYIYLPWENELLMYTLGTYLVHLVSYITSNLIIIALYASKNPVVNSWKISSEPWPWESDPEFGSVLKKVIKNAILNQIIVIPTIICLLVSLGFRENYKVAPEAPDFKETLKQVFFFMICEDFFFYWSHRMLHTPFLYKNVHKKHHEFKVTICIAGEYAHPVEFLLANTLPATFGPLLYGQHHVHLITWYAWIIFKTFGAAEGHSGYEFPLAPNAIIPFANTSTYHSFHHQHPNSNFGSFFPIWDYLMSTSTLFYEKISKSPKKFE